MPAPPAARLSLLGGFALTAGQESLQPRAPAQRVLAFLALHARARPVPRRVVGERLWCDSTSQRAASSLRSALWHLSSRGGPDGIDLVTSTPSTVGLAPGVSVDLWAREDRARLLTATPGGGQADPRTGTVTDLLDELSADLLPGWSEEWLLVAQESYRQTRLHALERVCADLCAAGRYPEAVQAGLAAVACEPLRESAHRRVIEVHLAEGNHAEALRQYQSFRRVMADELGLPPSAAIRRLVAPLLGRPVDTGAAIGADTGVGVAGDGAVTQRGHLTA